MKIKSYCWIVIILSLGLGTSCRTASSFRKGFVKNPRSMEYLIDQGEVVKSKVEILVEIEDKDPMLKDTEVLTKSWYIIPLLIVNEFAGKYELNAGKDGLIEEPRSFLFKKMVEQSQTNCRYNLITESYSPTYILKIEMDTIVSTHQIKSREGIVALPIASVYYWDIKLEDFAFFTKMKYNLTTPKGEVIYEGYVENTFQSVEMLYPKFIFEYDVTTITAEYIGLSLKQNIEDIINEINQLSLD